MSIEDPNELERVDEEIRRNELLERAAELGAHIDEDCPTEIGEQFLDNFVQFEEAPWTRHLDLLRKNGVHIPAPESLSDEEMTGSLWDVINGLAATRSYLSHTDHLSDRQLYIALYHNLLQEETKDLADVGGYVCHIDLIGSGGEEDNHLWLKYYATDEERAEWKRDWPADVLPPHVDPPYDRDSILPKPELPEGIAFDADDEFGDEEMFDDEDIFEEFREVNLRPIGDERPSLREDRRDDDSIDEDDIPM